ncbi:MAG: YqgE/AlgH family protein [Chitinophagaceae bacterium]
MIEPGPGILLIADPFLKDPNFKRTVVFLCEHQDEGTFGFVLNRKYEYSLNELVNNAADITLPVYYGGPVQMDTIHFLHQYPEEIPGGTEILKGIYWGGDFEMALQMIRSGQADAARIRFFIGYSGWGEGQLKDELKEKSWLLAEATRKIVFPKEIAETWKDAIRLLGSEYEMLINFPTDPQLN